MIFLFVTGLGACSTAGPFVTNISYDGDGGLDVEKCMVEMNGFTGTVSNKDCRSGKIHLRGTRKSGS